MNTFEAARVACFGSLSRALSWFEQLPFNGRIHAFAPFAVEHIANADCAILAETRDVFFRDWTQWMPVHGVSSHASFLEVARQ
jgi:hypothetical protein